MTPPQITGVLETAIHVADMKRAENFYANVLGFKKMDGSERFCAFDVGGDVFLLFRTGGSMEPVQVPGGVIPPHGSSGVLHFAFPIAEADWDSWIKHYAVLSRSCARNRSATARQTKAPANKHRLVISRSTVIIHAETGEGMNL